MPEYLVTETSLIGNKIVQPGTKVQYDGLPGRALQPLDAAGERAKDERARQLKPETPEQRMGTAIGMAINNPKKPRGFDETPADPPEVTSQPGGLSTVGHSSVVQNSAGGVDAQNLLETDADGKQAPQNPNSDVKPAAKADSPDAGDTKVDKDGKPAVTVGGVSNAVKSRK